MGGKCQAPSLWLWEESWMLERHLRKQRPSFDVLGCLGTWMGYVNEMLDEIMLALFMVETGFLARWPPSTPATFRADFFLRTFTLEKERERGFFSSARWIWGPEK